MDISLWEHEVEWEHLHPEDDEDDEVDNDEAVAAPLQDEAGVVAAILHRDAAIAMEDWNIYELYGCSYHARKTLLINLFIQLYNHGMIQ